MISASDENWFHANIAAGYLGAAVPNATLNSKFHQIIQQKPELMDDSLLFPQRLPREGFFEEVCRLEGPNYSRRFQVLLIDLFSELGSEKKSKRFLNLVQRLIRLGTFEKLSQLDVPSFLNADEQKELRLLIEVARINLQLSRNETVNLQGLRSFTNETLDDHTIALRVRIRILNRFVVSAFRYTLAPEDHSLAATVGAELFGLVAELDTSQLPDAILASVVYRGLAMIRSLSAQEVALCMEKMTALALGATPQNEIEEIICKENRYTGLQSLAKWNLARGKKADAETNLMAMLQVDPNDSTAFSELGFFHLKEESKELNIKASASFAKAIALGPPSVGMNTYYRAKLLEMERDYAGAISCFEQAIIADPEALSPWLDLIECTKEKGDLAKALSTARHLLRTPQLEEQLEDSERKTLQIFCN